MNSFPSQARRIRGVLAFAAYIALAWFGWLMWRITAQYWPIRYDAAFLQIKQDYIDITHWRISFFVHVFTSLLALAAGFTQFAPSLLRRWPPVHRWMGRLYVLDVCLVTGPASLIMAFYANGGITSRLAFSILATLWITTTALAYRTALRRQWSEHRAWMIRSYALTLSAITLRAWKVLIIAAVHPAPMDAYRIVAWLGFVPNLLIAEWWVRRRSVRSENLTRSRGVCGEGEELGVTSLSLNTGSLLPLQPPIPHRRKHGA